MFRCEGACHGLHSCVPLATEERRISVMLGKCGLSVGKCDKVSDDSDHDDDSDDDVSC